MSGLDDFSIDDMHLINYDSEEEPNNKSPAPFSEDDEEDYGEYISEMTFGNSSMALLSNEEVQQYQNIDNLENKEGFDAFFPADDVQEEKIVHEEDVVITSEQAQQEQAEVQEEDTKVRKLFVKTMEWVVETIRDGVSEIEKTSSDKKIVREYKKEAVMPKIVHAKPMESKGGFKKILLFLLACAAVGVFMGIKANSYYIYSGGKVTSAMSCAFSWLTVESLPYAVSPLYTDIFFVGFLLGFGILGVIGLFIWLDSDAKKNSRVGHEHGKARLGTSKDFKTFKNKFMEK